MAKFHIKSVYLFVLALFLLVSCSKDSTNDPTPVANKYLVSTTVVGEFTSQEILARYASGFFGQNDFLTQLYISSLAKSAIKVVKITYNTPSVDNKTTLQASGLIIYPKTTESLPLIGQHHGTLTNKADAPSLYGTNSDAYVFASLVSSSGFILACPDYIGYGNTQNLDHPYEHRASLAQSSLDMLRATKEYLAQEKINWNNKLMLTGYSEGGFATMAVQKKIEEEASSEFNLVASSCGAGAYNKTAFMKYLLNQTTHGIAAYNSLYIWVTMAYNQIYGFNRPASYYFNAPYAAEVQSKSFAAQIPVSINLAFSDTFRNGINNATDTDFLNATKDNDIFDWKPKTPTQLYHGNADQHVFYLNSETAYNAMKAKGADVTLTTINGADHFEAIQQYLTGTLSFFMAKK